MGVLSISPLYHGYLGYALPSIGRPPGLRAFYYWYGFLPSLALLYEPSGVGDCKGSYALTGPILACTYSTQHWNATQHTYIYNHSCSRIIHVLHTRVIIFGGKQYWFLLISKSTLILESLPDHKCPEYIKVFHGIVLDLGSKALYEGVQVFYIHRRLVAGGFWAVILTRPAWARCWALVWSCLKHVVVDKVVPKQAIQCGPSI